MQNRHTPIYYMEQALKFSISFHIINTLKTIYDGSKNKKSTLLSLKVILLYPLTPQSQFDSTPVWSCWKIISFWITMPTQSIHASAAAAAKSLQSCPTLCDPIDSSPPGSPVSGILQARTLEWVAISFSNAWKWKVKLKSFSPFWLLATPWTAAYQAPPSMGFSRQEYWNGVP